MTDTQVQPTVYGVGSANDQNVAFPLDSALPAARAAWRLADAVDDGRTSINDAQELMTVWVGPHRDLFDTKVTTFGTSTRNVSSGLRDFARQIAFAWAAARGQQDRINFARYCEDEASNDGGLENFGEFFAGETDYGPPPENPGQPYGPAFAETREPMYPQFGP